MSIWGWHSQHWMLTARAQRMLTQPPTSSEPLGLFPTRGSRTATLPDVPAGTAALPLQQRRLAASQRCKETSRCRASSPGRDAEALLRSLVRSNGGESICPLLCALPPRVTATPLRQPRSSASCSGLRLAPKLAASRADQPPAARRDRKRNASTPRSRFLVGSFYLPSPPHLWIINSYTTLLLKNLTEVFGKTLKSVH